MSNDRGPNRPTGLPPSGYRPFYNPLTESHGHGWGDDAESFSGRIEARSATLRIDIRIPGTGRLGVLEISGTDARLTDDQAAKIQQIRRREEAASGHSPEPLSSRIEDSSGSLIFGDARQAIEAFSMLVKSGDFFELVEARDYLPPLLWGEEALVPRFGSPPSTWDPLRIVAEQASAIGLGVTWGGSGGGPTLVGAYLGGLFLVKFVAPIVTEAGSATAAGVGAKIRSAFGIPHSDQVGPLTFGETTGSVGRTDSTETESPTGGDEDLGSAQ